MNNSNNTYLSLTKQLDLFINKYYRLSAIKGAFLTGGISLLMCAAVIVLEFYFHFSSVGRVILFFGGLALLSLAFLLQFLVPLLKSFKVLKRMEYKEAAKIISMHVPLINDQLINAIELEAGFKDVSLNHLLLEASVSQKAGNVLNFDLLSPLSMRQYRKYVVSFCLLFFIAVLGSLSYSSFLIEPLQRVVNFKSSYAPENPYRFLINDGNDLFVLEGETLDLKITTIGKTDPEKLIIYAGENRFFPLKTNKYTFSYSFKNVQDDFSFVLKEGNGDTTYCQVSVLPKAKILEENKIAVYPKYTELENDTFKDFSQVVLPFGTSIYWSVRVKNTSNFSAFFKDSSYSFSNPSEPCAFSFQPKVSQNYKLEVKNNSSSHKDSLCYNIELKEDQFPTILIQEFVDSATKEYKYFFGDIQDDYGFSNFYFIYKSSKDTVEKRIPIKYQKQSTSAFSFEFDFAKNSPSPGEKISYYFAVWDNDFLGAKETKSAEKFLLTANKEERKREKEESRLIKEKALNSLQKEISSFHKDLKEIKSSLINKKKMDWNDKNNIQNFLTKQKSISLNLEELQKKMNALKSSETEKLNAEIKEKQDLLNKMMDELMSDEMKKLYDELSKLVDKMNKDKVLDKIEDIDLSQENLIKELDRTIEHFKKLEIEKKAAEIAEDLSRLANEQDRLRNETDKKDLSSFGKNKKQEKIKSDFYSIKKDIFDLKNKNEELAIPKDIQTENEEENIKNALEKAQEKLAENKNKKAKEEQQKASEEMYNLADKMKKLSQSDQAQQEEDMASLRLLLEQLLTFSIQQENLLSELKTTNSQDPKYVQIGKEQRKLKDEIKVIDDSLSALSKRQIMISNKINSEVQQIKRSLKNSIKNLTERKTRNASANQQTVMMHTNELGLLLSEIMEQMQNKMPGKGQCNKPGGGGGNPGNSMAKSAEQLKKQIEAMKKFMEGQKNGQKPGGQKGNSFEQLGRMAAEQSAIKKELMEMAQKMNADGSGKGNGLKEIIKELEDVENQLINNDLDLLSINRQEKISIKLLELEKATKEQEEDKKRESKEAKGDYKKNNLELYNDYLKIKNQEIELLKSIPPNLKPYYKNKVNEYFKNMEKEL